MIEPLNDTLLAGEVRHARDRLDAIGRWYAARPRGTSLVEIERLVTADEELLRVARTARIDLVAEVERRAGPFDPRLLAQLLEIPRERFVRPEDLGESATDTPLLLDEEGLATISAPHAYLLSFAALGLAPGERIAELGTGSGYGAALASGVVGEAGAVFSIEIDEVLARRAARLLSGYGNVELAWGDAGARTSQWSGYERITVTFAVDDVPGSWLDALPVGGRMVVPVGRGEAQRLMLVERGSAGLSWSDRGGVRYVRNRAGASPSLPSLPARPKSR
jgi:protein-L-isoaspartate(D-aspartate) O-methyltransferase